MPDYLVQMDIIFPENMPLETRRGFLAAERDACRPYMLRGQFVRAWRTWGEHEGDHGHMALWTADVAQDVWDAYETFPLVQAGFARTMLVTVLHANPNDPGPRGENLIPDSPFPLTFTNLRYVLDVTGKPANQMGEGKTAEIIPGVVAIHDHPHSGRPREIHFMVADPDGLDGWQKVAEIGPPDGDAGEVGPGYIDFLAEWLGKPVHHEEWKQRILRDNGLLHSTYEAAVRAPRVRRDK